MQQMSQTPDKRISVHVDPVDDLELLQRGRSLAQRLELNFATPSLMMLTLTANPQNSGLPDQLELRIRNDKGKPVCRDLHKLDTQSPAGRSLKQPLVKALGIKKRSDPPLRVIDATAGWGEDTWLMLAQGCHVYAMERNPVMAALLENAIARATTTEPYNQWHVQVQCGDAIEQLSKWAIAPPLPGLWSEIDVVYLDPMFPAGRKTAQRKPMQVLHDLVGEDLDAAALVPLALEVAKKRVIVKRPPKAPALLANPIVSHHGKGVRYDVYVPGISKAS